MLAHADRLPECHIPSDQNDSVVFCHTPEPNGTKKWTGWARLTPSNYPTLPGNMDEGIWISRNVNLHPTACLTPPLFIGENSRIGPGVQLGPNAIFSHDGILDSQCRAENALIFRGSYIGESLELDGVIVDRNRLINVRVGATVSMADNFILGSLSDGQMKHWTRRKLTQLIAVILILGTWPILLLTALCLKITRRGPVLYKTEAVILPAASQAGEWRTFVFWSFCSESPTSYLARPRLFRGLRHFLLFFIPALLKIAKGPLRFIDGCSDAGYGWV